MIDKDTLKESLTIDDIFELLTFLGGEPRKENNNVLISRTICHNTDGGSYKLYYYDNSKLFHCYTSCSSSFDIYELICKNQSLYNDQQWTMDKAIYYLVDFFHLNNKFDFQIGVSSIKLKDWEILDRYQLKEEQETVFSQLRKKESDIFYDENILKFLPKPIIEPWEKESMTREVLQNRGIAYNPVTCGIIIPHYNENNKLVGIRERTLIKDNEQYAKYHPAYIGGKMYNHPLAFNLYNLNWSKDAIQTMKIAIIWESEKSCLKYASYFGEENDITVACCGSNIFPTQVESLLKLGVSEIVIGLDKQFQQQGDEEWNRLIKKLYSIHQKYSSFVKISFLFDKKGLLNYKDSPIDQGPEVFLQLFKERVFI